MKIGRIQLHLKARSRARLSHVSALLPPVITALTPHRTLANWNHVFQESWLTSPINREAPRVPLLSNRQPEESSEWSGSLPNIRTEPNPAACCATLAFARFSSRP